MVNVLPKKYLPVYIYITLLVKKKKTILRIITEGIYIYEERYF